MNNRYQSVCYNWSEVTERLRRDKQSLARFLCFSASLYKMGFPDAALVFYHDPNATKVAELEVWNRLGRFVNKGARSIAVFGEGDRCRHLFDISQTNGKPIPNGWRLTEDVATELVDVINENYGKECKDIHEALAAVAVDNIKAHSAEMQYTIGQMNLSQKEVAEYQRSVVSAVRFVVENRCEQNGGMPLSSNINLNAANYFKDTRDVIRFCDLVQRSAKDSLLEIEREVIQILGKGEKESMNYRVNPTGQMLAEVAYTENTQEIELLKTPISRWGRMWQEWVRTEYPTEVSVLIVQGRWNIIPREIDKQAEARFKELDKRYRMENPRPQAFAEIQEWEKNRLLTTEHQIMEEMIFHLRS